MTLSRSVITTLVGLVLTTASPAVEGEAIDPQRVRSAVDGGLRWLATTQVVDGPEAGRWPSDGYASATAAFAGLALLAHGHRPGEGAHGEVADRALRYVMATMDAEGYLGQGDRSGMYIHAVATLFGLSCLGTLDDPQRERELAAWCRKAVEVIVAAQAVRRPAHGRGGWRYTPFSVEADLSVTSWQLLVLHAARSCGYAVDDAVFDAGIAYVDRAYLPRELKRDAAGEVATWSRNADGAWVADPDGQVVELHPAGYAYRPGITTRPEASVTGAAVFVKSVVAGGLDPEARSTLPLLRAHPPSWGGAHYDGFFFFAAFYTTQGMFQIGGPDWEAYHQRLQRVVVDHQAGDGSWPFPEDNALQSRLAGRAYATAMALLLLAQERQYLPMYQRQVALY